MTRRYTFTIELPDEAPDPTSPRHLAALISAWPNTRMIAHADPTPNERHRTHESPTPRDRRDG